MIGYKKSREGFPSRPWLARGGSRGHGDRLRIGRLAGQDDQRSRRDGLLHGPEGREGRLAGVVDEPPPRGQVRHGDADGTPLAQRGVRIPQEGTLDDHVEHGMLRQGLCQVSARHPFRVQ